MKKLTILLITTVILSVNSAAMGARAFAPNDITLPPGFKIAIFAKNVPNARSIAPGPDGTFFIGSRNAGKVYAVVDRNGDFKADEVIVLARGLWSPNGVAYRGKDLYVAEINRVIRFPDIMRNLQSPGPPVVVNDTFPSRRWHGWKFIRFGPDQKLYVPVGAPCNVCIQKDPRFATIMRMDPDGGNLEIFAQGVRNTVGFDWHPQTAKLWFTDNGRDYLGDDLPPDELNHALRKGQHFGFPYYHGKSITDPKFGKLAPTDAYTPPVQELGPHVASLGMRFYTGRQFPEKYRGQILIAEHGSWNRSQPIGYRITLVTLAGSRSVGYEVFAEGWLDKDNQVSGRPVDLEVLPDGSLLVSDDHAGRLYRISYAP
jgi:glucose/arabinose dehydrogenase